MANLALSHRIDRAAVGDLRALPETPVQIGSFYVSSIDRGTGRIGQSGANTLLAAVDHLAFDLDHTPILAGFMNSVIQIGIYDPLRLTGSAPFACRRHRDQLVKQFSKDRTVMRQFVGNKQWLLSNPCSCRARPIRAHRSRT